MARSKQIPNKVYRKVSSDENSIYEVKVYDGGKVWCTCMGFKFRKTCRHTRELGLVSV